MKEQSDNSAQPHAHPNLIEAARQEAAELAAFEQPSLLSQDAVPGYEILHEIGRGGMGVVYKALQLSTQRLVALKVMLAGVFASRHARKRFRREVELAARLQHSGIVRVLESNMLPTGQQYYAMELVSGQPLDKYFLSRETDTDTIVRLFIRLCDAVQHAHEQGVIHRDLKPANVIIDEQGEPHVLDFGLAKASDLAGQESLTLTISSPGQVLGTLRYLSPEQAEGRSDEVDARTDIYSIGVTLYQALTGSLPCTDTGNLSEVIRHITVQPPPRPSLLSDKVDGELETIILKALEKAQQDRYASARELGDDLQRYLRGQPLNARPPSRLYRCRKQLVRQRRRIAVAAAAVLLASVTMMGIIAWRVSENRERAMGHLIDAEISFYRGRYQEAAEQARTAQNMLPKNQEALLVWAQARWRDAEKSKDEDKRSLVLGRLEGALENDPSRSYIRLLLGEMLELKNDAKVDPLLQKARAEVPKTAEDWHLRAFATLDPDETLKCELEAVARDPDHVRAWGHLAYLHYKRGDIKAAEAAAEELIRLNVNRRGWCMFRAEVLAKVGRYDDAAAVLAREAEMLSPGVALLRAQGAIALCRKEYGESIQFYTKATRINKDDDRLWQRYGRATPLWIMKDRKAAIEDYRAVIQEPRHVVYADIRLYLVLLEYADELEEQGDTSTAVSLRQEAAGVLQHGLDVSLEGSQPMVILKCFAGDCTPQELLNSTEPDDVEGICENSYYAGEAYLLRGDQAGACRCFRKCVATGLSLDPNSSRLDPMNEYHLALWRLDDACAAISESTP